MRVILIGGSSHSGKTTLAETLSAKLGASLVATDSLARHPGRPWRKRPELIPEHVREHYATLSVDELTESVLNHYERLWPRVQTMIAEHLADAAAGRLVIEGSALWPDWVGTLSSDSIDAVWLTAGDEFFRDRIYQSSNFYEIEAAEQQLVNKFLARTIRYNERMMERVCALHLPYINVENLIDTDTMLTVKNLSDKINSYNQEAGNDMIT